MDGKEKFLASLIAVLLIAIVYKLTQEEKKILAPNNKISLKSKLKKTNDIKNSKRSPATKRSKLNISSDPVKFSRVTASHHHEETKLSQNFEYNLDIDFIGKSYRLIENYSAIKLDDPRSKDFPSAFVKMGHKIIPSVDINDGKRLMYNTKTRTIGIMTGIVKVSFKDGKWNSTFFKNFDSKKEYPSVNKIFFKFNSSDLAIEALEKAKSSTAIKRASLELIEYERKAR